MIRHPRGCERILAVGLGLLALLAAAARAATPQVAVGESIYLHGQLGSGEALAGVRPAGGVAVKGAEAACLNCHQRSGLGTSEGYNNTRTVPPITGLYLYHARGATTAEPILPYLEWMHGNRDPYTDATLARAIREGLDSRGRPLSYLMPHFKLGDADMSALIGYLKQLGTRPPPGVTDSELHFATIITPDADSTKRGAMLEVMQHYFAEKNRFPIGNSKQMRTSGKTEYAKSMFMSHRLWKLHVWELTGPDSSWQGELEQHFAQEPVLAVLSGLGGANWAPIERFCEKQQLLCLFPNVEVPVDDSRDFYSLYFSRGVVLEADLIASAIGQSAQHPAATVVQVYRMGDSGEAAASALASTLKGRGVVVRNQALPAHGQGREVPESLRGASGADALVLWLRADDLSALGGAQSAPATVYVSGTMAGLERAPLPDAWRSRVKMAYPVDLPERRALRLRYPLNWFSIQHIPVVDEPVQADTYLACGLLAETLSHMADNFSQALLVEMLQSSIERRLINTGYYPRLVLGWNQHFASKGGYIVNFADPGGTRLAADSDWTVP